MEVIATIIILIIVLLIVIVIVIDAGTGSRGVADSAQAA